MDRLNKIQSQLTTVNKARRSTETELHVRPNFAFVGLSTLYHLLFFTALFFHCFCPGLCNVVLETSRNEW